MSEYNKISSGVFTGTAATAKFIPLAYKPTKFEIWNKTEWGSSNATPQVQYAVGFADDAIGTALIERNTSSAATLESAKLTTGGFTFVDGSYPVLGAAVSSSGAATVARANPTQVNITAHGFVTGDTVWLYGTTGMLQIAGVPYTITRTSANQFTIPVDSTGFAADGTAATARQWYPVGYPNNYSPFNCVITAITRGSSTTVTFSVEHDFVVGQEVQFVLPAQWGTTQLDGKKGYVTSITSTQIVVDINSSSYTAFAYPTSATAALAMTFPQVVGIGDANSGYIGPNPPFPLTIPGAFRSPGIAGVNIGASLITNVSGGGATIEWRAEYPDQYVDET